MYYVRQDELCHYGVEGMRWGVRRYQNPDGTRTALGKRRERKGGDLDEGSSGSKKQKKSGKTEKQRSARKKAAIAGGVAGAALGAVGLIGKKSVEGVTKDGGKKAKAILDPSIKGGKDKPNVSPAEKVLQEANKLGGNASSIAGRFERKQAEKQRAAEREKKKKEMAKLSDDELRKRINRLNLEKQYSDLTRSDTELGKWTVQEKIDLATDIGSIALNLATIGTTIYLAKKKIGG